MSRKYFFTILTLPYDCINYSYYLESKKKLILAYHWKVVNVCQKANRCIIFAYPSLLLAAPILRYNQYNRMRSKRQKPVIMQNYYFICFFFNFNKSTTESLKCLNCFSTCFKQYTCTFQDLIPS